MQRKDYSSRYWDDASRGSKNPPNIALPPCPLAGVSASWLARQSPELYLCDSPFPISDQFVLKVVPPLSVKLLIMARRVSSSASLYNLEKKSFSAASPPAFCLSARPTGPWIVHLNGATVWGWRSSLPRSELAYRISTVRFVPLQLLIDHLVPISSFLLRRRD